MYDPIIKELFPNRKSLYMEQLLSAPTHDSFELPESYERNDALWKRHNLDYLNGDYNLSHTCSHYGQNFFPSTFARKALLCSFYVPSPFQKSITRSERIFPPI